MCKEVSHERKTANQECQTIADWLTPIDYGPQQSDYIKRRQPGTGQWLLHSNEFQNWLIESRQTLFCPGIPGAGKTLITAIVVEKLFTKFRNDTSIGIAFLYCNYNKRDEQKIEDLLSSLLKQLIQEQSSVPKSVEDLYDQFKGKRMRPSFDEISRVLHLVTTAYSRVFIIVDALDECQPADGCRARLLSEIFSLQAKCDVSIFATSRPLPEIKQKFEKSTLLEIRARDEDVRKYLDDRISESESHVLDKYREQIKIGITKAVDGMYDFSYAVIEDRAS